jgi:hypothetical protein
MKSKLERSIEDEGKRKDLGYEPLPGHEERFEMRLLAIEQKHKLRTWPSTWWIGAAAAAAIGVIVFIAFREVSQADELLALNRADANAQVMAMDSLYQDKLAAKLPPEIDNDKYSERITKEIERLEMSYKILEKTLQDGGEPDRIIEEMVKNYQFRIRLIEQLRQYLIIKKQNQDRNEKVS